MKQDLRRSIARWVEAGRGIGFLVLLIAGSAALGFLIAWPLWLFATSARRAYTITVLGLACAGILLLIVQTARRNRRAMKDPGKPGRAPLLAALTVLAVLVGVAGAYIIAALLFRGLWILGAGIVVLWGLILWLIGRARRALKNRKERAVPAENGSE